MDAFYMLVIIGGIILLGFLLVGWILVRGRRNRVSPASNPPDQTTPAPQNNSAPAPKETTTAVPSHRLDEGEHIAAPFAEQIEDQLHTLLQQNPDLAHHQVDLGTAADGSLEIWVDGQGYSSINQLPDDRLQLLFQQAIERWEQRQS